jgi:hypothetical protein
MPLALTDEQLDIVMAACRPLAPHRRDSFVNEVATELARYQELGVGVVHRVCATVQRRHFDPPQLDHDVSKYR